ncbi:3-deoxy-D-manno-octulosonic acid transferase [Limnohabitans sp. 15K]|uniref:3-deoxy-D-manno-octulosonic acid transferase n=1 Tax=Limnohabitans sp. 15K TaxID=1100706 RepID=UPI000C1F73C5|nr:3-deoxy-D-manno-octulosonic acid transferase [Limnohabitans sp. 15K]PIT81116.1 3-deoxy-D-manno-octulosonic acid transferase [Limnohabitans sp. 15K]
MTGSPADWSWRERWALLGYDWLMQLLQPLLRIKLKRRARQEPEYGVRIAQRFGRYSEQPPQGGFVWLHAVSLGETRAAALLLPALREAIPGMRLLLTHSTATGWHQGRSLLQAGDQQAWLPWDTEQATRQFLTHFKPSMGLLMETEVWPNLVQTCRQAQVPLCLINARMSEKSCTKALRWPLLSGPAYRGLSAVLAQTPSDAHRLRALGCPAVDVVGNLKFDVTVSEQSQALALRWQSGLSSRQVVMLASTREGEELMWLQALQSDPERLAQFKALGVLWLLVPRHPQRFDEVHALLEQAGCRCEKRSAWGDLAPTSALKAEVDVLLGDSLGEMQAYYLVSQMALLGGSFAPLGGQNLIEAAACGCPVVMGPHTFNFSEAAESAAACGAALRVPDMQAGLDHVLWALSQPQWLIQARGGTQTLLDTGRGAVTLHSKALKAQWLALPLTPQGDR